MKWTPFSSLVLLSLLVPASYADVNVLQNPSGEGLGTPSSYTEADGELPGWDIINNGGSGGNGYEGWNIRDGGIDGSKFFQTYFGDCSRSQTIDLVEFGFPVEHLDGAPEISVSEWFRGISNGASPTDTYYLIVELRDANGEVIERFENGTAAAPMTIGPEWTEIVHTFSDYGPGLRSIYWEDGGDDTGFWAGHYGTMIDAAQLVVEYSELLDLEAVPGFSSNALADSAIAKFTVEDPNPGSSHSFELGIEQLSAQTALPLGTVWSYLDDGSDQGTAWREVGFDDAAWAFGGAPLGYGDPVTTEVSFGADDTLKFPTTYYRTTFNFGDAADVANAMVNVSFDDGAAVYLNGVEIGRVNLPAAPGGIDFQTFATATVGDGFDTIETFEFDPAMLNNGENTLAVEIHQANATSSDTYFDLELIVERELSMNDNALFYMDGDLLRIRESATAMGATAGTRYEVYIVASDHLGQTIDDRVVITVGGPTSAPPTSLALDNDTVSEGLLAGALVGNLTTADPDGSDVHYYELVAGAGGTDNADFAIDGTALRTATPLSVADGATRSVRLRSVDPSGGNVEGIFVIQLVASSDDSDSDGLLDAWELSNFGNLAFDGADNPDGDPRTNLDEQNDQTDPTDGASFFGIVSVSDEGVAGFRVTWNSEAGRTYQLQGNDNQVGGAWINVGSSIQATGATTQQLDSTPVPNATQGSRFYRVMQVTP